MQGVFLKSLLRNISQIIPNDKQQKGSIQFSITYRNKLGVIWKNLRWIFKCNRKVFKDFMDFFTHCDVSTLYNSESYSFVCHLGQTSLLGLSFSLGHLHLSGMWFGVPPRTDTKKPYLKEIELLTQNIVTIIGLIANTILFYFSGRRGEGPI